MKKVFIGLLRARIDATCEEEIRLSESVLHENALDGDTFWSVLCPLLQREGLIKYYSNPDVAISDFNLFMFSNPEYTAKLTDLDRLMRVNQKQYGFKNGSFDEEIENTKAKISEIATKSRKDFDHKFLVDKEKIVRWIDKAEQQKPIISVDRKRGVYMTQYGKKVFYPRLKPSNKIFKLILFMMNGSVYPIKELCEHTKQKGKVVKSSIKRFNENFSRIFAVNQSPVSYNEAGYELNKERYDFV